MIGVAGIGNRESEIGNWESGIGNRESGMGNRESEMGEKREVDPVHGSRFTIHLDHGAAGAAP